MGSKEGRCLCKCGLVVFILAWIGLGKSDEFGSIGSDFKSGESSKDFEGRQLAFGAQVPLGVRNVLMGPQTLQSLVYLPLRGVGVVRDHLFASVACGLIDFQNVLTQGSNDHDNPSYRSLGYCTSAEHCLNETVSSLDPEGNAGENYQLFSSFVSATSSNLHPTCYYISNDGSVKQGICCRKKRLSSAETTSNTTSRQNVTVTYTADERDTVRSFMDRGHIQSRPSSEDGRGNIATSQEGHRTDSIPYDNDYIGLSKYYPLHPTHPPLPTHPPGLTNKPWWVNPSRDDRQTTKNWWQVATTTTQRPATTRQVSKKPPLRWWEIRPTSFQRPKPSTSSWRKTTTTTTTTPTPTTSRLPPNNDYCSPSYYRSSSQLEQTEAQIEPVVKRTARIPEGGDRIIGGGPLSPNSFPWIAVLFQGEKHVCGGSLIDEIHILTAAHCVASLSTYEVSRLRVILGMHNLYAREAGRQEYLIKTVIRHKDYSRRLLYNDVAILTLTERVLFTDKVKPICLYSGSDLFAGDIATVAGWGSLYEGGSQTHTPRKVDLKVWSNEECKQLYGLAAPGGIVPSYLCAGRQGKDACSGDSGGPIVTRIGGVWQQIGIVSWGIGCGKGNYPGVYSRISEFLPWIRKVQERY